MLHFAIRALERLNAGLRRAERWVRRNGLTPLYLRRGLQAPPGSEHWLTAREMKYGGFVTGVAANKVSSLDRRPSEKLSRRGMVGGDRMSPEHHGYQVYYSRYLHPFVKKGGDLTIVEIGILKGTGLAIWCDLFPDGRVIGLDIDLGHTNANMANLRARGAFQRNSPRLHEFDSLLDNREYLGTLLEGRTIDVLIDDGLHWDEAILNNFQAATPFLAPEFVCFVEDNRTAHKTLRERYPQLTIENFGLMSVIRNCASR